MLDLFDPSIYEIVTQIVEHGNALTQTMFTDTDPSVYEQTVVMSASDMMEAQSGVYSDFETIQSF